MAQKLYNCKSAKHDIALVADLSNGKSADILQENSPIPKKE
jgi:hypothetical protein